MGRNVKVPYLQHDKFMLRSSSYPILVIALKIRLRGILAIAEN